jgi:hypothetical protein
MATKIEQSYRIEGTPQAIMDIMRNAAFIEESEKARDALTVKVTDKQEDDDRHVFEIFTQTYARGATGIDKSKTEDNRTTVNWDKKQKTARWDWSGPHGKTAKVSGGQREGWSVRAHHDHGRRDLDPARGQDDREEGEGRVRGAVAALCGAHPHLAEEVTICGVALRPRCS